MEPHPYTPPSIRRVKLNVGGTLFETTTSTLISGGSGGESLLSTFSSTSSQQPIFIDRDPHLFSALLSLLRTHRLPSRIPPHILQVESLFYGFHSPSLPLPSFSPFDSSLSFSLSPPSDPFVSAISFSDPHSSLLLAHNGLISSYNHHLSLTSTLRTHLDTISSLRNVSSTVAAVGSDSAAGVHFYSVSERRHVGSTLWVDPTDPRTSKARVNTIADDLGTSVFASFECWHGENVVLAIDKETLKPVSEIGRQSGNAAKSAAMKKLTWVPSVGLLIGSSVKCGGLGYSGLIRAWDPRAGGAEVWETSEPGGSGRISRVGDTMADVGVDPDGLFIAKVGSKTGDVGVADLRHLGPDPWVYLEDPNPRLVRTGVARESVVVSCYKKHVLVGREGGMEVWSRLKNERELEEEEGRDWGLYRRNYVDKEEDEKRGVIAKIECGMNKMFVCRENCEGVEVWESSDLSGAKLIL